jgi:hypothetical protein
MSIPEFLIVSFFFIFAIYTGVGLLRSIVKNSQQGILFREKLLGRVKSERLHPMLGKLGIDDQDYLHSNRVNEIEKHISRCQQCSNTSQCDRELEQGLSSKVEEYCPNNSDLLAGQVKSSAA